LSGNVKKTSPIKEQIEARFAQNASEQKQEPLRALHALEAKLQQVRKERPEAEAVWEQVRAELGDTPPPYFQAILMACGAVFALLVDTIFLAPTMEPVSEHDRVLSRFRSKRVVFPTGIPVGFSLTMLSWFRQRERKAARGDFALLRRSGALSS
jgi:hypothetical protein